MEHDTAPSATIILGYRMCAWCTVDVPIERRPGRPRLYCGHACRQRAYEHRHGFLHNRAVTSLPGQRGDDERRRLRPTDHTGYEAGGMGVGGTKIHALRISVRPEGHRRTTMCGLIKPPNGKAFSMIHPKSCKTCSSIVVHHPIRHPIEPSNELARLRALIDEAIERRVPPDEALRWLAGDHPWRRAA